MTKLLNLDKLSGLLLLRLYDNGKDTLGICYYRHTILRYIYMLEDTYRDNKVAGETRIPSGKYDIEFRKDGRLYGIYIKSKNAFIRDFVLEYGMPYLVNVPNFEGVALHSGNNSKDSLGCPITGDAAINNSYGEGWLTASLDAMERLFRYFKFELENKHALSITIIDMDREIRGLL